MNKPAVWTKEMIDKAKREGSWMYDLWMCSEEKKKLREDIENAKDTCLRLIHKSKSSDRDCLDFILTEIDLVLARQANAR